MQEAGSSSTSSLFRNDPQCPASIISGVTTSCPVKRITFFRSGDAQFNGVRMAIHTRNFKCFDALLDNLSQKVPLPFGVRTITTPRGTHAIRRLEQLKDGGCYICSDRRYVKPVNVEAAGRRPTIWLKSDTHNSWKKPTRPEEPPVAHSGLQYHWHPKRIILVRNTDPAMRRSITLSRRMAQSLRMFMDDVSKVMQCQVRKLYTLDGRKIDSIQSLMRCPSMLVCVGKESFNFLLPETLEMPAKDKMPGMSTQSRFSDCSEGQKSKRNVNFGLETKKSIIHPRSDSSNKSTRFSLSSGKSYQSGLCAIPGQSACVSTCPYTKEGILNDDTEKGILVNKDGSLSVEMKVRFRLVNDETLHWSTKIKKSAAPLNKTSPVKEGDPHNLQDKLEYSDLESSSACEVDDGEEEFIPKRHQKHLDESCCQNCNNHCQEYDIWKSPMDNGGGKSSSCSGSACKIKHKKALVNSVHTLSRSSEEYIQHVVHNASCFQQTVDERERCVQYCSVSRSCSRSEVSTATTKLKSQRTTEDTYKSDVGYKCRCDADREPNTADFHDSFYDPDSFEFTNVTKYYPNSAVSNSSKVFESLKEGRCDDNLTPSESRTCEWLQNENLGQCVHYKISQASENVCLSPRPPSNASSCSVHTSNHKKYRNVHPLREMPHQWKDCAGTYSTESARCTVSKVSSQSQSCHCGATSPRLMISGMHISFRESAQVVMCRGNNVCNEPRTSTNYPRAAVLDVCGAEEVQSEETECDNRFMSTLSANTGVFSGQSTKSTVYPCCSGCKNANAAESRLPEHAQHTQAQKTKDVEVMLLGGRSPKSHRSGAFVNHTHCVPQRASLVLDIPENGAQNNVAKPPGIQGHGESVLSVLSKQCNNSNQIASGRSSEAESMCSENDDMTNVEEKPKRARSVTSNASAKSSTKCILPDGVSTSRQVIQKPDEVIQNERAVSLLSDKSNGSARSRSLCKSHHSNTEWTIKTECNNLVDLSKTSTKMITSQDVELKRTHRPVFAANNTQSANIFQELRMDGAMSTKSNFSSKSAKSQKAIKPSPTAPDKTYNKVPVVTKREGVASVLLDSSKISRTSNTLSKNRTQQNVTQGELSETENVAAQVSECESKGRVLKTPCPERSYRSHKLNNNIPDTLSKNCDGCVQTMENDPLEYKSAKSPTRCLHDKLGELLRLTSTASISLGLDEACKCENLSEESISSMSQNLEEVKCLSEILIPKSAVSDHSPSSSEKAKTSSSMSCALSEKLKKSFLQDHCKNPKHAFSLTSAAKSRSVLSTKSKAENTAGCQLYDSRHTMLSGRSGSSDVSCSSSSCRASKPSENNSFVKGSKDATQAVVGSQNGDKGETDIASAILERFSKCNKNKTASGKATATSMARSKDQCAKKIKNCSYLEINVSKRKSACNIDSRSFQSLAISKGDKRVYKKGGQTSRTNAVTMTDVSQNSKVANRNMMPTTPLGSSSDSVLSHTPSATDLLGEKSCNSIPDNRASNRSCKKCTFEKVRNVHKYKKSSTYKKREKSLSSQNKNKDQGLELMPSDLPNASPVEVVNDWLRKIPVDHPMFEMGVEFNVQHNKAAPVNAEKSLQKEIGGISENVMKMKEFQEIGWPAGKVTVKQDISVMRDETLPCNETSQMVAVNTNSNAPEKLTKRATLPKCCQSSVQVMKVLISPKLDRCNSLPEISPTYGKKLSTSAKELLDCLINHQLIDSKNYKDDKYNEILSIFQSLWIFGPSESEQDKCRIKDNSLVDDEYNPRSSSGIDESSGFLGSGRVGVFSGVQKSDTVQSRITPIAEQEPSLVIHENTVGKEVVHDSTRPGNTDGLYASSQPVTPDIARRMQSSPEEEKMDGEQQDNKGLHGEEVIQRESQKERNEMATTFCKKCCRNYRNTLNTAVDKGTAQPGDTNSGTFPFIRRGALTKRVSQDPDLVWVLRLLRKLEKQFMSHYENAVEEFKVKWDLNASGMLDTIIGDLKEEVHKRIRSSINRELPKIHSRAGRTTKPPISSLYRHFTTGTDERRRRLKVLRNKSINPSLSRNEEINSVSGTEFRDQRNEDEYCPCDTCMRKKTASRGVQQTEAQSIAPVMMDFDLRKILQNKKVLSVSWPTDSMQKYPKKEAVMCFQVQEKNLEVVDEEAEVQHDMRRQSDDLGKAKKEEKAAAVQTKENLEEEAVVASENWSADVGVNDDEGKAVEEKHLGDGKGNGEEYSTGQAGGVGREEVEIKTGRGKPEEGKAEVDNGTNDQGKGSKNKEAASDADEVAEREAKQTETVTQ